ncbi:MAG TPA: iron-containing alcohol dehydrogenase [Candidatus Polarisedimenticolia bacterium]|nr:iron-containing alcohol dehydrogenase [Candidatus Polarisedimenticolia bacterium]
MQQSVNRAGDWIFPTQIRFGAGRLAELADLCRRLGMSRPLVVTDRGLAATPIAAGVMQAASRQGVTPVLYGEVQENPTGEDVGAGAAAFNKAGCDGVVALGGGSGLDCGKAVALLAGCGGSLWRFAWPDHEAASTERGCYPVIAIPTTAGTGAEVETASMITDPTPAKKAIVHPGMLPKIVIADPELTLSLPARLTAATGMDALSHNLEALLVPVFNPMADAIALEGIVLVARHLATAVAEPANIEARAGMMTAAIMGATSFCKGLGAMHALSHAIGALHERHHGLTNAVVMPYVLAFNRPAIGPQLAQIAAALKLDGDPFAAVHGWIVELRRHVGIPHNLTGLNLGPGDFPAIARLAAIDGCAATNPVALDEASCLSILQAAA